MATITHRPPAATVPAAPRDTANPSVSTWLALLGVIVVASHVEISILGLDPGPNGEVNRVVTLALAIPGALLLAFDQRARSAILRLPMLCLTAALAWIVVTSPFGENPTSDLVVAIGLASLATFGAWAAFSFGWERTLDAIGAGLAVFIAASLLAPLFTGDAMLDGRLRGLAIHPNELGLVCVITVAAALSGVTRGRRSAPFILLLAVAALLATDSRTSLVAAIIVAAVWARPILGRAVPMLVTAAGFAAIAAVLATGSTTRVSEATARTGNAEEITSGAGRLEVWEVSLDLTNAEPIAGYGANSNDTALDGLVSWGADHPHNLFLQMGLIGGWPALLLTIAAFATYWVFARRNPSADRDAVVVAIAIVGLTEAVFRRPGPPVIVLAAALVAAATHASRTEGIKPSPH